MAKQVQVLAAAAAGQAPQQQSVYVTVNTYDQDNKNIGHRVVDMHHFGTPKWIIKHAWWATHNGHTIEITNSSQQEIEDYIAKNAEALQAKFSKAAA